jgi:protein-S-isoprenylcysteine O-methyltransferase Ste14
MDSQTLHVPGVPNAVALSASASSIVRRVAFHFLVDPSHDRDTSHIAAATTAYILIAIQFEERDLLAAHAEYEVYRQRVPLLMPFLKFKRRAVERVRIGNES